MKDGIELQNNSITTSVTHTGSAAVFQSTYSISNISSSDIGTYTCTVTNPIGSDSLDIVVDAIVGKQVSVLLYSLDAYSHVLMHICDLILENRRYTYNGTFVIQVFAIEFGDFAIEFVPFAIEFVAFAIEFVPFAIEFVSFAIEFVAFAIEFVPFAIEFVAFAIEFVAFAVKFVHNKNGSWSKHENMM